MSENPDLPAVTTEQLDTLAQQMAMIDPNREGITADQLRLFYPRMGWRQIFSRLNALVDAGRAAHSKKPAGQVSFDLYTLTGN